jgi:hypothetical protein
MVSIKHGVLALLNRSDPVRRRDYSLSIKSSGGAALALLRAFGRQSAQIGTQRAWLDRAGM